MASQKLGSCWIINFLAILYYNLSLLTEIVCDNRHKSLFSLGFVSHKCSFHTAANSCFLLNQPSSLEIKHIMCIYVLVLDNEYMDDLPPIAYVCICLKCELKKEHGKVNYIFVQTTCQTFLDDDSIKRSTNNYFCY